MIKLNLATKPGLQEAEIQDPVVTHPVLTASTADQEQVSAVGTPEELLEKAEQQLAALEQEEKEFVPRHVSLPPQKKRPEEKEAEIPVEEEPLVTGAAYQQRRRKATTILIGIILLVVVSLGGWVGYQYYATGTVRLTFVSLCWNKIRYALGREAQPVAESVAETPADTIAQPVVSQLSEEYAQRVMASAYFVDKFSQFLAYFPAETRFKHVKLNFNRIIFIAYPNNDSTIAQIKNSLLSSGDYEQPEVFYAEARSEGKQLLGVIQIKPPWFTEIQPCRAYSDNEINQKVWEYGKKAQLEIQPLVLYGSNFGEVHDAEVNASGEMKVCGQFLQTLAGLGLNWSMETITLKTAALDQTPSTQVNLTVRALIYPPAN